MVVYFIERIGSTVCGIRQWEAGRMIGKTMEVGIFMCFVYIKKTKILKSGENPSGIDFMPII